MRSEVRAAKSPLPQQSGGVWLPPPVDPYRARPGSSATTRGSAMKVALPESGTMALGVPRRVSRGSSSLGKLRPAPRGRSVLAESGLASPIQPRCLDRGRLRASVPDPVPKARIEEDYGRFGELSRPQESGSNTTATSTRSNPPNEARHPSGRNKIRNSGRKLHPRVATRPWDLGTAKSTSNGQSPEILDQHQIESILHRHAHTV